jgi:sulfite exporter TauE/SafE
MLASINPLGERGRNQRYRATIAAYVVGSTLAGAALGGVLGLAGAPLATRSSALAIVAAVALAGLALDARAFGLRVPGPKRQVNENWLVTYRGWVYGAGMGIQLGLAFATIVTASATWLAFACALLAGSAPAGALVGATFGLARALPLLTAARVGDPSSLHALARRLERLRPRVAVVTTAAQGAAAAGLLALLIRSAA